MSPERTNHVTSLPVRPDRSPRADRQPPASDFFATLLDAHADRTASRRDRQPSDERRPVDRPACPDRPADVGDRSTPAPAADRPASAPTATDEPAPADQAAAAAAASAMLGLLAAVAPQQPAAQAPAPAAPVAEEPVAPQPVAPVPAAMPQPAAEQGTPSDLAATAPVVGMATVEGAQALDKLEAPTAAPLPAGGEEAITVGDPETSVAGRESNADPGNTRPADRRWEAVSGAGPEARPSVAAPVNPAGAATDGRPSGAGSQGDQRQSDSPAPVTAQGAQPTPQGPTQRIDVAPLSGQAHVPAPSVQPRGAATLAQAPRAVGQLIHLASERGVQHARLNLRPAELGGIEIRLVASSAGVSAHVVADSPEAARLLQQAGEGLRRSLADSNVELLSLDVSTSDQERRDASAAAGGFERFGDTGPRGRDGVGRPQQGAGQTDTDLPISTDPGTVIELPDGVLVDVLA